MILEKQTQSLIHQIGGPQETIGMSLDLDSAQVLMQMLSKNLYADSIGSTIRECASNALDSHRRAGVIDTPIVVKFGQVNGGYEFSVEDFGTGLDNYDVENIISKYGKSTKRNSNTELGMMGLGFKAPLAYSSSFYFITRKDGIERKYMMYEGEEVNSIDLLSTVETESGNGVKIIVPVKYTDKYEFPLKIREQLAYFESVYIDCNDINPKFTIYRSEDYQTSTLCKDSYVHVCLDNVYYPLDFEKIGMTRIALSIGLRFSLSDGIFPTPNRESLRYTQEAKKIIRDKIYKIANSLMNSYNASIQETVDVTAAIEHFSNSNYYIKNHLDELWDVTSMLNVSTIPKKTPTLKGYTYFTAEHLYKIRERLLKEYQTKFRMRNNSNKRLIKCDGHWNKEVEINDFSTYTMYIYKDIFGNRKKRYLKETTPRGKDSKFIKKMTSFTLFSKDKIYSDSDFSCYHTLLQLDKYSKSSWRDIIKEFQGCVDKIISGTIDLDALIIPQSWLDNDKANKVKATIKKTGNALNARNKKKGDVNGKIAQSPERYTGSNAKFTPKVFVGKLLPLTKLLHVYAKEEDRTKLDHLFGIFKGHVEFIILSDREIKLLESYELHNWMSLETFLKGDNMPFRRTVTARLIKKLADVYSSTFCSYVPIKVVLDKLSDDISKLISYKDTYIQRFTSVYISDATVDVDKIAYQNNRYDFKIYSTIIRTEKLLSKFDFVEKIAKNISHYKSTHNDDMLSVLVDMCRYKKLRMVYGKYNITTMKIASEEVIESLEEVA